MVGVGTSTLSSRCYSVCLGVFINSSDNERLHAESQLNLDQTLFGENRHLQERIRWLQVQLEHCQQQLNDVRSEPVMGNFLPAGNVSFSLVNIRCGMDLMMLSCVDDTE